MKGDLVTFETYTTAPFFARILANTNKPSGSRKAVPVVNAEWIGALLARLTPQQIRDAFRAAGYQPAEVDGFAKVVKKRIVALNHLKE